MTLASSSCIQLGIFLDFDRLILPVKRERKPNVTGYEFWRLVALMYAHGYSDKQTAAACGRSAHRVYEVRKRLGLKKYRDDRYVRAWQFHQLKKAA